MSQKTSSSIWKWVSEIVGTILWDIFFGILLILIDPHEASFALYLFFLLLPICVAFFSEKEPDKGYGDFPEDLAIPMLCAGGLAVVLWLIIRWII